MLEGFWSLLAESAAARIAASLRRRSRCTSRSSNSSTTSEPAARPCSGRSSPNSWRHPATHLEPPQDLPRLFARLSLPRPGPPANLLRSGDGRRMTSGRTLDATIVDRLLAGVAMTGRDPGPCPTRTSWRNSAPSPTRPRPSSSVAATWPGSGPKTRRRPSGWPSRRRGGRTVSKQGGWSGPAGPVEQGPRRSRPRHRRVSRLRGDGTDASVFEFPGRRARRLRG